MHKLKIGTVQLPTVYVVDQRSEIGECRRLGVPYIIKPRGWSDEKLIKAVLWRTLHKRFPDINWRKMLGFDRDPKVNVKVPVKQEQELPGEKVQVEARERTAPSYDQGPGLTSPDMEVSDGYRETAGGMDDDEMTFKQKLAEPDWQTVGVDDYLGEQAFGVSIEELQALKVLPVFMDDIANAVKLNIMNTCWIDGYNKKLGIPIGHYKGTDQAPNLIILDTSGSIPSGVAGTMVSLIDTLRSQANADLIITSGQSVWYPSGTELPSPDDLAYLIGGCNEARQFYKIIKDHVLGKHWGNVIVFGDYDAPTQKRFRHQQENAIQNSDLQSTRIDRIMAFHTYAKEVPGYGLWARNAAPKAELVINTAWVDDMRSRW